MSRAAATAMAIAGLSWGCLTATGKDAGAGKQTIVARIGLEAAQRQLGEMIHDALSALIPFGERAAGLRAAAKFFAERQS